MNVFSAPHPTPPEMTHMHFVLRVFTRVNGFTWFDSETTNPKHTINNQKQVCKPQGGGSGKELGTAILRQPFKKHGSQKQRYHTDKKQKQKIEAVISGPNLCIFPPLGCAITILFFFWGYVCCKKEKLQSEIAKTRPSHCRRIQHTKNTLRVSRFVFFNQETHQERYNELQHVAFSSWVVRHAVGWTSRKIQPNIVHVASISLPRSCPFGWRLNRLHFIYIQFIHFIHTGFGGDRPGRWSCLEHMAGQSE